MRDVYELVDGPVDHQKYDTSPPPFETAGNISGHIGKQGNQKPDRRDKVPDKIF